MGFSLSSTFDKIGKVATLGQADNLTKLFTLGAVDKPSNIGNTLTGAVSGATSGGTEDNPLLAEQRKLLEQQIAGNENTLGLQAATNQEFLNPDGSVNTTGFFPGQITQGFDPAQLQALQQQQQLAQQLQGTLPGQVQQATQFGLEGVLDPASNPAAQRFQQAALDPVIENFTERVLPNLGSAAQQAGAFGGSRQGQLEAGLSRDLIRQMGDITANIQNQQFSQGLDAFGRTQALLPGLIQSQFLPSQALADVGEQRRGLEQEQTAEDVARFNFGENIAGERLADASSLLGNVASGGGGGGTTTGGATGSTGGLVGALGGAATGAGALGAISTAIPAFGTFAAANPWVGGTVVGLSALAGLLG